MVDWLASSDTHRHHRQQLARLNRLIEDTSILTTKTNPRPNIIICLVDDLGFSDLGSYGSRLLTRNIDRLAENGIRCTQMYNSARCCPSRAALLTGLYPHQAGVGHMTSDYGIDSYQGYLNDRCVTIAEVLRASGYRTLMSGKWHVGGNYHPPTPEFGWPTGERGYPTPRQRGFDRFFGIWGGYTSFFNPDSLGLDDTPIKAETTDFYLTDEITNHAVQMIDEGSDSDSPFFLYLSYTAPHWPLHALEEDIAKYEGAFRNGWDAERTARHEAQKGMGLLDEKWRISARDIDAPDWNDARHQDWEDLRMAVYAAQIDRVDQGVGRIMDKLRALGEYDNTLFMFLSDNGGCAELFREDNDIPVPSIYSVPTVDGRPVTSGNIPGVRPGPDDTFMSYDLPWANVSNAPFRLFKSWIQEGGISTPFIVHWPNGIKQASIDHSPMYITDITATCIDAAGATYPTEFEGRQITPIEGESFMSVIQGERWTRQQPIFWEHEGNRAVRVGEWKLVAEHDSDWELYNMDEDRTELNDLVAGESERARQMTRLYEEWAAKCQVLPWPANPRSKGKYRTLGLHNYIA